MQGFNQNFLHQWMSQSSLQALDKAYQCAQIIQKMEETYFEGRSIAQTQTGAVTDYFRSQLDRQLWQIRTNLLRFKLTGFVVGSPLLEPPPDRLLTAEETAILDKLTFIETIVGKYRDWNAGFTAPPSEAAAAPPAPSDAASADAMPTMPQIDAGQAATGGRPSRRANQPPALRLFGGASQIGKELSPKYEQEMVQALRQRRVQNQIALRWIAALLILPLVVQIAVKQVVLNPVLGGYSDRQPRKVELSDEIAAEFLHKFGEFKETLEVRALLAKTLVEQEHDRSGIKVGQPRVDPVVYESGGETIQETLSVQPGSFQELFLAMETDPETAAALEEKALQEKALELWREAREHQLNGLKNVIADGVGILVFVGMVFVGRRKLTVMRSFANRAFLNLNDPTKVFLFILITDMFVGFHSAEGWEVILEGFLRHFGLPESKALINGFIATVPVVIDSCIKFWIFSYLTRYSPSASAIYERMNT